jgi:hypothetical protein
VAQVLPIIKEAGADNGLGDIISVASAMAEDVASAWRKRSVTKLAEILAVHRPKLSIVRNDV